MTTTPPPDNGAMGALGPACRVAPESIDCLVESLPWATVAFNTPEQMDLDKTYDIVLRLSPTEREDSAKSAVKALVGDSGAKIGTARVRFAKRMSASLEGAGFDVSPSVTEPRVLAISETSPTDWLWQVTPRRTGQLRLTLSVDAQLVAEGKDAVRPFRVFSKTIAVKATATQQVTRALKWVEQHWTVLVAVFGGLLGLIALIKRMRRRRVGFGQP